jgi:hypothetical protein
MVSHPILAAIDAYTRAVEQREIRCNLDRCPRCGECPDHFTYHASRKRQFLVIVGRLVQKVVSALTRWKCPNCIRTFTFYPDFAVPHKRYVRDDVCRLTGRYVAEDGLSYRKAVQVKRMPVYYDAGGDGRQGIDERVLWPSTLHRWIGFVGRLRRTLREAWQLVRARSPTCDAFREVAPIPCWKYRSEQRKHVLQHCGRLLRVDEAYRGLFKTSIFPYLATLCRWS